MSQSLAAVGSTAPGDDKIDDLDHILGEPEEEVVASEPEADSGEPEAETETEEEPISQEPEGTEDRRVALAKELGLDPVRNKAALDRLLLQEKRNADKDSFIEKLKSGEDLDFTTEFDRQLSNPKEEAKPVTEQPARQQPAGPIERPFGWKNSIDAAEAFMDAASSGDKARVAQYMDAWIHQVIGDVVPYIQSQIVEPRLQQFKERDLGGVTRDHQRQQQERMMNDARRAAERDIQSTPGGKAVWDKLWTVDEKVPSVEIDGVKFPNNAFNRILSERPEILDIRKERAQNGQFLSPADAARATYTAQLQAVAREYVRQRRSGLTPEKAKQLVASGAEMAKRESRTERARQALSGGGGRRGSGPQSTDDEFVREIADANTGTTGTSFKSLFR